MAKDPTEVPPRRGVRDRVRLTHETVRAHPTGRVALKIFFGVLGGIVVAVGIALIPLPGPGWLIVIGGLAIWAVEFVWARHLLQFTKDKLKIWTDWIKRQSWLVRGFVGIAGMVFVGLVVAASIKLSFDVNVFEKFWDYITTH
jgi:uncharacterized protein (TIGR02611 family)